MTTALNDFLCAIQQAGLTAPDEIVPDGKLHRFASNGDRDDGAGWYVLFDDGIPAGSFGCWRMGIKHTWSAKSDRTMTATERAAHAKRVAELRRIREAEEAPRHADAAQRAQNRWSAAQPAPDDHPYLQRKDVQAHGLRIGADGRLIVPIYHVDTLSSVEFIDDHGNKEYLWGGAKRGGSFILGKLANATTILECEGYATGASLYEATNLPTVIAFDAGNLLPVAKALRAQFPAAQILICGDHDENGVGQEKARAAAGAVGGCAVIPDDVGLDWNDVAVTHGLEMVRQKIVAALTPPHILVEVHAYLGRFVAYPSEHAHVAHTLWAAHTHFMDKWDSTPRLAALSPEPSCGKTRRLETTETVVPRPVEAINTTPAYLFRKVSDPDGLPTILYDEIDTLFGPKAKEHEEIRAIINAGHRRGATAGRCVVRGTSVTTEELPAYCAVAMAGLGNLPDTIITRSVVLKMRRRAPTEVVEPYRRRIHAPEGYRLRDRLAEWAADVGPTLNTCPAMPDGITDRAADVWEPLLAVADAAGGDWPAKARVTAVTLVTDALVASPSLGIRLLADLRTAFGEKDAVSTVDLLALLIALEEAPWGDLKGKPLDARRLSRFLHPYGVSSKTIRIGSETAKGYTKESLWDAWARYLPPEKDDSVAPSPDESVTSVTSVTNEATEPHDLMFEEEDAC